MKPMTLQEFKKVVSKEKNIAFDHKQAILIVVYKNPTDFLENGKNIFVARAWKITKEEIWAYKRLVCVHQDYQTLIKKAMPVDMIRLPSSIIDDPCIVETWI